MLCVLGVAGSGKTVHLGMLADILSRAGESPQMLLRGARSLRLQQDAISALAGGRFPPRTPAEPDRWNWLHAQVQSPGRRELDLVVPDIAGASLVEEVESPGAFRILRPYLSKCDGAIVTIDAPKVAARDPVQEFALRRIVETLALLDVGGRAPWAKRPVAIVLTKSDACEPAWDDPTRFLRTAAEGLWRDLENRLRDKRVFATSVAGACGWGYDRFGKVAVPLRIEPHGVVEPFAWLVERLHGA